MGTTNNNIKKLILEEERHFGININKRNHTQKLAVRSIKNMKIVGRIGPCDMFRMGKALIHKASINKNPILTSKAGIILFFMRGELVNLFSRYYCFGFCQETLIFFKPGICLVIYIDFQYTKIDLDCKNLLNNDEKSLLCSQFSVFLFR